MQFRLLGLLEVADDRGDVVSIGPGKESSLLAMLLLQTNEPVSTDRLADGLWGDRQPANATKTIQVYVSRLRKRLAPERLVTTAGGYVIKTQVDEVDIERFERLAAEGRQALENRLPEQATRILSEALALWRGLPLADFGFDTFAQLPVRRLVELREAVAADRVDARLSLGETEQLLPELEELAGGSPVRERLRAQLMLCLYRCGRQAEALDAYQETRAALVDDLGIEPSHELRELHLAILRQDPALDAAAAGRTPKSTARGAFVGRRLELAELCGGLDDAFAGRGRLFVLVGEPGIGKSRLAEELIGAARARKTQVLVGRCWEAGGAPAYWPWVQSLRSHVRDVDLATLKAQLGAGASEIAQILPELRDALPDLVEPSASDPEAARFRLFDATAEFLRNAARERPILLFLDDLHAADAPSLLLLQFLARELASMRVVLLGACRDVDPTPTPALAALLTELAREPVSWRIALSGLREQEVAEYLELTAAEIASPGLAAVLHRGTDGNPLFVGETVRLAALEGLTPGPSGSRLAIPQTVRDVIGRRLAYLSAECNQVLERASVLGREFGFEGLARLSRGTRDDLLDAIDEAVAARVISDVPGTPGRLRFAHVLIRDTLYEGLTSARRLWLHREAVGALEALYGTESGPHLAELAHHSIAGRDFAGGLQYSRRAGDRALELLAYEEAGRLYEAALQALELANEREENVRCELLLSLGEAQARAGDTLAAKKAFLGAADIARHLGLRRELARAAGGYAGEDMYLRAGHDVRLVPLLEEGLAALIADDVELRARLLARLAGALRGEISRERRDGLSREAIDLARRTGNQAALAYALDGRIAAIIAPDTLDECLAVAAELREVAERIDDVDRFIHGHLHHLVVLMMLGDATELEAGLTAMSRIAVELRQPGHLWEAHAGHAALALAAGRLTEAEEHIEEAFAFGERTKPEIAIPVYRLQRYLLCDFRGNLDELEPAIRALVAEWPARPAFRCALTHLCARLERVPEARRLLADLTRDDCAALPFEQEWLLGMSFLAETSALVGDSNSTAVLYRLLSPWEALNAADWPEGIRGSIARYLGMLAAAMGRWEDAERHFERAVAMNEAMNARPWIALTQLDHSRMALARNLPGDHERARTLLESALATFRELDMNDYTATAEALARQFHGVAEPTGQG